jgi:hypothetical protein
MVDAPQAVVFHAERIPETLLCVFGDGLAAKRTLEGERQQIGVARPVDESTARRLTKREVQNFVFKAIRVIEARVNSEKKSRFQRS